MYVFWLFKDKKSIPFENQEIENIIESVNVTFVEGVLYVQEG